MDTLAASDLPLMISSLASRQESPSAFPLDRVRMQKGIFLVAMGGPPDWQGLYDYRPYNWGPYSSSLANDLDRMTSRGLLRIMPVPGSRYGSYVTTERGSELANARWTRIDPAARDYLHAIYRYVTSRSFNRLLSDVYSQYPEYATASLFNRPHT